MDRAEQLTRELFIVHKSGEHAVAYAVARIMALEELCQRTLNEAEEYMTCNLLADIKKLVPEEGEGETNDDQG